MLPCGGKGLVWEACITVNFSCMFGRGGRYKSCPGTRVSSGRVRHGLLRVKGVHVQTPICRWNGEAFATVASLKRGCCTWHKGSVSDPAAGHARHRPTVGATRIAGFSCGIGGHTWNEVQ